MTERESENFDFDGFKRAFTTQNIDAWASYFADDAEWLEYRHTNPPRSPNRMVGKKEITNFLSRISGSGINLTISDEVIGPSRAAFCVTCLLPDGQRRIIEHVIIHYSQGKITRQVDVEAWD